MFSYISIKYLFPSGDGIVAGKGSVGSPYSEYEGIYCFIVVLATSQLGCNTEQDSCMLTVVSH